jgi:hypothetical protein
VTTDNVAGGLHAPPAHDVVSPAPTNDRRTWPTRLDANATALWRWRYADASALTLMVVAITGFNLLWIWLDSSRLYWDTSHHLGDSVLYQNIFTLSHPLRFFTAWPGYPQPPLVYWVTNVFYAVFGNDLWVADLSIAVFLGILVFATYGIGKTLWSRRVGLMSALFVVTSPLFVSQFKWYMIDAPLSAMVALALYFLIKSDGFADRRSSLLFGVAFALGMLTKWPFAFFVALPAGAACVAAVAGARRERSGQRLFNVGAAALLAFALAGVWYLPNFSQFHNGLSATAALPASVQHSPPAGSLPGILWYFWDLVNNELYLIPFLFFVAGLVFLFRKDESAGKNSPLVLSIVGGYFAFTLIALKTFRYTMPMLPAVAVVATHWLDYLKPRVGRRLSAGLIAYGVAAFFVISFGTGLLPKSITIPLKARSFTSNILEFAPPESPRVKGIVIFAQHGFLVGPPSSDDWHQDDVFNEIVSRGGGSFWYSGPQDEIWFQTWGIRYYSYKDNCTWVASTQEAKFLIIRGAVPPGATAGFLQIKRYRLRYSGPLRLYERV